MTQTAASAARNTADLLSNAVVSPEASLLLRQILDAAVQSSDGSKADWVPVKMNDLVSNAVVSPKASLLLRQILDAAVRSSDASEADWVPEARALLANVMMNDRLNWWNPDSEADLGIVQNHVDLALKSPRRSTQAHAHHAQALIHRERGKHDKALSCFEQAIAADGGFARAYAQIGNQHVRLGQETKSYEFFQQARSIAENHPAIGYFDWGEGRAYFQEGKWPLAIYFLRKSVKELPTVWYNRCFLAAAQEAAEDKVAAEHTIIDFVNDSQFVTTFPRIKELSPRPTPKETAAAAWRRVLDFVKPRLP